MRRSGALCREGSIMSGASSLADSFASNCSTLITSNLTNHQSMADISGDVRSFMRFSSDIFCVYFHNLS